MYFTSSARCSQLLPLNDELTGLAYAGDLADMGNTVLYVSSGMASFRMKAAEPVRAAHVSHAVPDTSIYIGTLHDDTTNLKFDAVVLDVKASNRRHRSAWMKFIDTLPEDTPVFIAYDGFGAGGFSPPLRAVRMNAVRTASEVGKNAAHAFGQDDTRLHSIRGANKKSWYLDGFAPGITEVDAMPVLSAIRSRRHAIRTDAMALAVDTARGQERFRQLEKWAGQRLSDDDVEVEIKHYALSVLRALSDPGWARGAQVGELHLEGEEQHREVGADKYADDRVSIYSKTKVLLQMLPDRLRADVVALRVVTLKPQDSVALQGTAESTFRDKRWRARDLAAPSGGVLAKLMTGTATPTRATVRRIESLLKRLGYTRESTQRLRVRENGKVRQFTECRVGPRFNLAYRPVSVSVQERPIYKGLYYKDVPAHLVQNRPNVQVKPGPNSAGVTVLLAPGIERCLGPGDSHPEHARRLANLSVLLSAAEPLADGWQQVSLPGPAAWLASRAEPKGRVYAWGQSVPNFARPFVCAPPTTTFVNFDFKNAHFRIAERMVLDAQPRNTFFAGLFADGGGDLYSGIGARIGVSRDVAKLCALALLNGGTADTLARHADKDAAWAAPIVAAWRKHNPWIELSKGLTAKCNTAHQKNSLVARVLQRHEATLLRLTLAGLATSGVQHVVVLPMYDGALLACFEGQESALMSAIKVAASAAAISMGMPSLEVTSGSGITWGKAQE